MHGLWLQRRRCDRLPYYRISKGTAHCHADKLPCALQRTFPDAHTSDRLLFCQWKSPCGGLLRVPAHHFCGTADTGHVLPPEPDTAEGRPFFLCVGIAALPPPEGAGRCGAQHIGQDGVCAGACGDGCHSCRSGHLAVPKRGVERTHPDLYFCRSFRASGLPDGAFRHDSCGLPAWDSRQ